MAAVRFLDKDGTFTLDKAENYSYLYLPVANEKGLKAAVTPDFGGDKIIEKLEKKIPKWIRTHS
mgnify:CR=1 FL=1